MNSEPGSPFENSTEEREYAQRYCCRVLERKPVAYIPPSRVDSVIHPEGATSVAEPSLCAGPSMLDSDPDDHEIADSASIATTSEAEDGQHALIDLIHNIIFSRVPTDGLTTVNFTHDLSGVHELNNCMGFSRKLTSWLALRKNHGSDRKWPRKKLSAVTLNDTINRQPNYLDARGAAYLGYFWDQAR